MTIMQNNQSSKAARDAYRKVRNRRNLARAAKVTADLPEPIFTDIVDATDNLLNGPDIKRNGVAKVTIAIWTNVGSRPGHDQIIRLYVAPGAIADPNDPAFGQPIFTKDLTWPFAPTWDPNFTVPLNEIQPNGTYTFKYEVRLHTLLTVQSPLVTINTDITAPYELTDPPEPPAMTFATVELDDSNLDAVSGVIPDYTDKAAKDTYRYWFAKDPLPADPTTLDPVAPIAEVPANRTVIVPQAFLETLDDDVYYLLYTLYDRATSRSRLSGGTRFILTRGALPSALQKPVIPAAAGGAVVNLETAQGGVIVEYRYTGWKSGDKIVAKLGGLDLPEFFAQDGYAEALIPPQTLLAAYKAATGTGERTLTVEYVVDRLGRTFGPEEKDFTSNLTLIGTPLDPWPDFPNATNPKLLAGEVQGLTGKDVLVEADADKPVKFQFPVYDPVNAGEKVKIFWVGKHVPEADHTMTNEAAGGTVTKDIPWSYVVETDNGLDKEMYYSIGDPAVTPNWQNSLKNQVDVNDAIVLKPDAPTLPHIVGGLWLNCDSLQGADHHIQVDVPDLSKWLTAGDKVNMSWELFEGTTDLSKPIADTLFEDPITVTDSAGAFPLTGFAWKVTPYADYIAPSYNPPIHSEATAVVTYSFELNGKTVTSKQALPWLGMFNGNGACTIS